MISTMTCIWLVALVFFIVVEITTVNLVSIWFAAGSLVALLSDLFGAPQWLQIVLFFAVSCIILAFLRPFVRKYVTPRKSSTNSDMVIGQICTVTEDISNLGGNGAVYVKGKTWTARSSDGATIPSGTLVRVIAIEGVKLIVEKAEETAALNI